MHTDELVVVSICQEGAGSSALAEARALFAKLSTTYDEVSLRLEEVRSRPCVDWREASGLRAQLSTLDWQMRNAGDDVFALEHPEALSHGELRYADAS